MTGYPINQTQMDEFMSKIVESFSGKDFTLEDIQSLCNFKKQKKEKKEKKEKDPNAPKRALSAWIYFTTAKRPEVKEQNPGKKTTELTTIMSEMWRDYTDEQKQPYKDMEIADKKRYQKEKDKYESSSDSENEEKVEKKAKKAKDENAPKRNLNSYMLFCKEMRAKHVDVKHTQAVLKTMWADLDDKSEYTEKAKVAKETYLKEKAEYESNK
jgi:hypothetical protein